MTQGANGNGPGKRGTIESCLEILRGGGLIALPTETVYGLGADALNPDAVLRIFAAKDRPSFNPSICHLADPDQVFHYGRPSEIARKLTRFWPGPLTMLLPHEGRVPSVVTAGSPLCAFRVPRHASALELLSRFNGPVAAPSANRSGKRSPTTADMVADQLADFLPPGAILDGGPCEVGLESTVVSVVDDCVQVLRHGGISIEELREGDFQVVDRTDHVDEKEVAEKSPTGADVGAETRAGLQSPGSLLAHYAPEGELWFLTTPPNGSGAIPLPTPEELGIANRRLTYLAFGDFAPPAAAAVLNLSPEGDLHEAARNLFSYFDRLNDADLIIAPGLPEHGLGRAVNDRLFRAATRILEHRDGRWVVKDKR